MKLLFFLSLPFHVFSRTKPFWDTGSWSTVYMTPRFLDILLFLGARLRDTTENEKKKTKKKNTQNPSYPVNWLFPPSCVFVAWPGSVLNSLNHSKRLYLFCTWSSFHSQTQFTHIRPPHKRTRKTYITGPVVIPDRYKKDYAILPDCHSALVWKVCSTMPRQFVPSYDSQHIASNSQSPHREDSVVWQTSLMGKRIHPSFHSLWWLCLEIRVHILIIMAWRTLQAQTIPRTRFQSLFRTSRYVYSALIFYNSILCCVAFSSFFGTWIIHLLCWLCYPSARSSLPSLSLSLSLFFFFFFFLVTLISIFPFVYFGIREWSFVCLHTDFSAFWRLVILTTCFFESYQGVAQHGPPESQFRDKAFQHDIFTTATSSTMLERMRPSKRWNF